MACETRASITASVRAITQNSSSKRTPKRVENDYVYCASVNHTGKHTHRHTNGGGGAGRHVYDLLRSLQIA